MLASSPWETEANYLRFEQRSKEEIPLHDLLGDKRITDIVVDPFLELVAAHEKKHYDAAKGAGILANANVFTRASLLTYR